MIYILHHNRYWTEYVDFLLKQSSYFKLVASAKAVEDYNSLYRLSNMERFDPQKHKKILTPGRLHEPTKGNQIIMRYMHSPGFYVYSMIRAYADLVTNHKDSDYQFLIIEEYYRALMLREIDDPAIDHFRFLMLNDPKIQRLKVDPSLIRIKEKKVSCPRKQNSCLIALTWLVVDSDFSFFLKVCEELKKKLNLSILMHPLMRMSPQKIKKIQNLKGSIFENSYYNLSKAELIDLYDQFEYIATDGSGSCYEAMIRGCKPLAIRGMRSVPKEEKFNEILENELFPFPDYTDIEAADQFDYQHFLQRYFPYLFQYSQKEAEKIAIQEILEADQYFYTDREPKF